MRHYPSRKVRRETFKGVEVVTVPSQSLTLREIIKRFIRKESLPIEKEGFYNEQLGDIEKMERMDITERHEMASTLKGKLTRLEQRFKAKAEKEKLEKEKLTPLPVTPITPNSGT